ncbi:14259_t:CDS:2 [Acaulospora colombiana]|uniref:14259_t:CDS:1 n=1 Tax=Acaulospora colombiana TaxID=27376 RepID=A0ACA9K3A4_9GLOM|nr:14259_t:CDS:2 [Acaulospora colombiana]
MALVQNEQEVLLNTRAGGVYIPPARLRLMQQKITDKSSEEYQRITWEALKKSINGLINKVNTSNIKNIVFELINENLIRGRGLFARSIMKAQAASLPFTPVYAALIAIINTKLPQVGELVLTRLIVQFRKAYRRNDKTTCLATTTFIAHLCNHLVAHEIVALQILVLLLENPTSDSVEVAVGFMREVGSHLAEVSPKANNDVFDRFRAILHEANVEKRVQYMIEVLFQIRKDKYKDNPPISSDLDLVKEEDQITHHLSLDDDDLDVEETLVWAKAFEQCFVQYYETIHRYETNRLRNVSKYFGHLLASDALSWQVFSVIKLTEDDTTSSSRIFVKILFEELCGTLGMVKLKERLKDETMKEYYSGLFPKDNPRNTRFAINYFTSIGLGILTDELREHLQNVPKLLLAQKHALESSSDDMFDTLRAIKSPTARWIHGCSRGHGNNTTFRGA